MFAWLPLIGQALLSLLAAMVVGKTSSADLGLASILPTPIFCALVSVKQQLAIILQLNGYLPAVSLGLSTDSRTPVDPGLSCPCPIAMLMFAQDCCVLDLQKLQCSDCLPCLHPYAYAWLQITSASLSKLPDVPDQVSIQSAPVGRPIEQDNL